VWVGNVYIPPAQNLTKRNIAEDVARSYVEDITSSFPNQDRTVVCGDWNARIGTLSPTIDDNTIPRLSDDTYKNARAPWLIEQCEIHGWQILNGLQPGPAACHTFARGSDRSCIDFIFTNTGHSNITYDPHTLNSFSDHVLIQTKLDIPYLKVPSSPLQTNSQETIYKWVEGSCLQEYGTAATKWSAFTS
jgi:hypothetical protein